MMINYITKDFADNYEMIHQH